MSAYTYRPRGKPLEIPTPGSHRRVAVEGAMRWPDGPFLFSHGPKSVNTGVFLDMFAQVQRRARRTGKRIVLVLDNGSSHVSKRSLLEIERESRMCGSFGCRPTPPTNSMTLKLSGSISKRITSVECW